MMEQGFLPDKPVLLGYEQVEEQAALLKEMALKYNISLDCGLKKPEHLVQKMETYLQNLADRGGTDPGGGAPCDAPAAKYPLKPALGHDIMKGNGEWRDGTYL